MRILKLWLVLFFLASAAVPVISNKFTALGIGSTPPKPVLAETVETAPADPNAGSHSNSNASVCKASPARTATSERGAKQRMQEHQIIGRILDAEIKPDGGGDEHHQDHTGLGQDKEISHRTAASRVTASRVAASRVAARVIERHGEQCIRRFRWSHSEEACGERVCGWVRSDGWSSSR